MSAPPKARYVPRAQRGGAPAVNEDAPAQVAAETKKKKKKKKKKVKPLPTSEVPYVDTHMHIDRTLDHWKSASESKGGFVAGTDAFTWEGFLATREVPPNLDAYITVLCDPPTYMGDEGTEDFRAFVEGNDKVYCTFGVHPHTGSVYNDEIDAKIRALVATVPNCVAVGECGLDYFRNNSPPEAQMVAFERQMQIAIDLEKPLVVHARDAADDALAAFERVFGDEHRDQCIHLHCFSGSADEAAAALAAWPNLFIGITGALTFPKSDELRDVVRDVVPLDRLLLETDGPYMAPKPYRGSIAYPGHCLMVAQQIADLKEVTLDDVLEITRENTRRMYGV